MATPPDLVNSHQFPSHIRQSVLLRQCSIPQSGERSVTLGLVVARCSSQRCIHNHFALLLLSLHTVLHPRPVRTESCLVPHWPIAAVPHSTAASCLGLSTDTNTRRWKRCRMVGRALLGPTWDNTGFGQWMIVDRTLHACLVAEQ